MTSSTRVSLRAGVAANKEPAGLLVGSAMRPDGATMIPWARRKCLAWDTGNDTRYAWHLRTFRRPAPLPVRQPQRQLRQKPRNTLPSPASQHLRASVAVETLGTLGRPGYRTQSREIGRRSTLITKDPRETSFLLQRISVAVQRGQRCTKLLCRIHSHPKFCYLDGPPRHWTVNNKFK